MDGPWTQYASQSTSQAPAAVPAGPWTQYAAQKQAPAPDTHWAAPEGGEFGDLNAQASAPASEPGAVQRVVEAAGRGAVEGFGDPIGSTILSPKAQDWMDDKQRKGGVGGFLAGLGSTVAKDIGTVGGVVAGAGNALFRGAQGAVAQTGAELGAPQLGRDLAAIPEAFMGSPGELAHSGAPIADRPFITARQIQARDGVGMMEAWNRAHTENTARASAAIADIGKAPDIDSAIAAAGKAAAAPGGAAAGLDDLFTPKAGDGGVTSPLPSNDAAQIHTPADAGDVLGTGDLWQTSPEELQSMLAEKSLSDRQKTVKALGSEAAALEFYRLDRKQNSDIPHVSDEGSREFDAKFGNLTPEQERMIYGIGETGAQAEDIKQVLDAHSNRADNPTDAGYEAASAIRRVPAAEIMAVPDGKASPTAQAAYVRLQNAYEDMRDSGVEPNKVAFTIADALVQRGGWSPEDAGEIVGNFVDKVRQQSSAASAPAAAARPQITGPNTQAAAPTAAQPAIQSADAATPQSVGAAASREQTHPSQIQMDPAEFAANRAQGETERLAAPPAQNDREIYVPGTKPTLAEVTGNPVSAMDQAYNRQQPEAMTHHLERETQNADAVANYYADTAGSAQDLLRMERARDTLAARNIQNVFGDPQSTRPPADPSPTINLMQGILDNPRQAERNSVVKILSSLADKFYDDAGNLKTDPYALYGIGEHINDLLRGAGDTETNSAARVLKRELVQIKDSLYGDIEDAAPGFAQYRADYQRDSKAIDAMKLLQDERLSLLNGVHQHITPAKWFTFMRGVVEGRMDPMDPASSLSEAQMDRLWNITDHLKRSTFIDAGKPRGSWTSMMQEWGGRFGRLAAHGIAASTFPVVGNLGVEMGVAGLRKRSVGREMHRVLNPDLGQQPGP